MPDPIGKKSFVPGRSYDINLTIKDKDYSNDLTKVQIVSSLNSIYDLVKLELLVDPRDILTDITGENSLKLSISLIGELTGQREEKLELELMVLQSSFVIQVKEMLYEPFQLNRVTFPIMCITKKPFKTMTTLVNKIYIGETIKSVIEDLVESTNTGATLKIDEDNLNEEIIDQILIPPVTLSKAIKNLDKIFGIYKGIFNMSCQYDNTVQIRNLTKRLDKEATFTVYQLANDDKENLKYLTETSKKENVYVTYDIINTSYSGNTKASVLSKNLKYIVKPTDTLYHEIDQEFNELSENYGLSFSTQDNKKMQLDSNIDDRTRYYTSHTGYEKTEEFAIANTAKSLANSSTIDFRIERNMNILPLINVGKSVKLNSNISEYINLTGKYILKSTIIDFDRVRDWEAVARIYLIRTNKDR